MRSLSCVLDKGLKRFRRAGRQNVADGLPNSQVRDANCVVHGATCVVHVLSFVDVLSGFACVACVVQPVWSILDVVMCL